MKMNLYYFVFVSGVITRIVYTYSISDELNLHQDKFTTVQRFVRPKNITSEPINVAVQFYLLNIYFLDEKEQVLKFNCYFDVKWTNDLLAWNESQYGSLSMTLVSVDKIWLPDLYVINAVDDEKFLYGGNLQSATLFSSGLTSWWPSKTFSTMCPVDTKRYPFDIQKCRIKMVKWLYQDDLEMLTAGHDNIKLDHYNGNGEWDILTVSQNVVTETVMGGMKMTSIIWTIELKRKGDFYILNIILPIIVLSFLNIFCFMLPADSGEKIGYSMSVFLTFSVFTIIISDELPKTSDEICLLSVFLILQLTYSALIIIMNVLILQCVHNGGDKEMNFRCLSWLKNICESRKKNRVKNLTNKTKQENKNYPADDKKERFEEEEERHTTTWKEFATFLDKFFFLAFVCMNVLTNMVYILMIQI